MTDEAGRELSRADFEAILRSAGSDVRSRFEEDFPDLIGQFLDECVQTYGCLQNFGNGIKPDLRAAWTEAFLFNAFNSSLTSCHLLMSGLLAPSGNLMRHYGEACAMALLCSHHAIDVIVRLIQDPAIFPVHKAVQLVRKPSNMRVLRISAGAWTSFETITKWYDQYSHASAFSLATQQIFGGHGGVIIGSEFDDAKRDDYQKELRLRGSSMSHLRELAVGVAGHVRAAQAERLIEHRPTV